MTRMNGLLLVLCGLALAACGGKSGQEDVSGGTTDATEVTADRDGGTETAERDPCKGEFGNCGWNGDQHCPCPEGTYCAGSRGDPDSGPYGHCVSESDYCEPRFGSFIECGFAWSPDAEFGEPPYCGDCPEGQVCIVDYNYPWDNHCCELQCDDSDMGPPCGDDGCGGSCGECGGVCQCNDKGQCFDPCVGKECGDDGYGGSCGDCPEGMDCVWTFCFPGVSDGCDLELGPADAQLNFNSISPQDTKSKYVALINKGDAPCTVNSVTVTEKWGGASEDFALTDNWLPGDTVEALSIETIEVQFSPHSQEPPFSTATYPYLVCQRNGEAFRPKKGEDPSPAGQSKPEAKRRAPRPTHSVVPPPPRPLRCLQVKFAWTMRICHRSDSPPDGGMHAASSPFAPALSPAPSPTFPPRRIPASQLLSTPFRGSIGPFAI